MAGKFVRPLCNHLLIIAEGQLTSTLKTDDEFPSLFRGRDNSKCLQGRYYYIHEVHNLVQFSVLLLLHISLNFIEICLCLI